MNASQAGRIQAVCRFVEHQQPQPGQQCGCETQTLPHLSIDNADTAREAQDAFVAAGGRAAARGLRHGPGPLRCRAVRPCSPGATRAAAERAGPVDGHRSWR